MQEGSVTAYSTALLYAQTANGKIMTWQAHVYENENGTASILIQSGYEGGTLKETTRSYNCGKNAGKKNATTALQQAVNETKSRFKKQLDKGYRESKAELSALPIRPMLAQSYIEHQNKIKDSTIYICQPKLNGVRCTCQRHGDKLTFLSRTGKAYDVLQRHKKLCKELLEVMPDGCVWDGEIYCHGMPLQDIVSAVKAYSPATNKLQYWVYDTISEELQFERIARYRALLADKDLKKVVACPIDYIKGIVNIKKKQKEYLAEGYEGLMLRNYSAKYRQGIRSYDLLKYKQYKDINAKISGFVSDVNGAIIFMFRLNNEPFYAVPSFPLKTRQAMYKEGSDKPFNFIGKVANIRCVEFSKKGLPIGNPIVTQIRLDEDVEQKVA